MVLIVGKGKGAKVIGRVFNSSSGGYERGAVGVVTGSKGKKSTYVYNKGNNVRPKENIVLSQYRQAQSDHLQANQEYTSAQGVNLPAYRNTLTGETTSLEPAAALTNEQKIQGVLYAGNPLVSLQRFRTGGNVNSPENFQAVGVPSDTQYQKGGVYSLKPTRSQKFVAGVNARQIEAEKEPATNMRSGINVGDGGFSKSIAQQQAREKKYGYQERVQRAYDTVKGIVPRVPVVQELVAGAATFPVAAAGIVPVALEKAYVTGRGIIASPKNTYEESLRAANRALSITGRAATFRDSEGKVTKDSVATGIGIYGGAFLNTLTPKVQTTYPVDLPTTRAKVFELTTKVEGKTNPDSIVYGSLRQTSKFAIETNSAFGKLLGKANKVSYYQNEINALVSGERNLASNKATFDIIGRQRTRNLDKGKIIKSKPFNAKGVQFDYKNSEVTAVGSADKFISSLLLETKPAGVANVPFSTGIFNGKNFRLYKPRSLDLKTSMFEEGNLKNPSAITKEGRVLSKGFNLDIGFKKTLPRQRTILFDVDRFGGKEVFRSVERYNDVSVSRGKKNVRVAKVLSSSTAFPSPSASYLEAYKQLYGRDLRTPKTSRADEGRSFIDIEKTLLADYRRVKSASLRSKQLTKFSKRMEAELPNRIPAGLEYVERFNIKNGGGKTKLNQRSAVKNSGLDFASLDLTRIDTIRSPKTLSIFPPVTGSFTKNNRTQSIFQTPRQSNSRSAGTEIFGIQTPKAINQRKQSLFLQQIFSPTQLSRQRPVLSQAQQTRLNNAINLSSFALGNEGIPRGFGLPAWLGGSGSSSGSRPYASRKGKVKYEASLAGLFLRIKKGKGSLQSERLGFGVRGI